MDEEERCQILKMEDIVGSLLSKEMRRKVSVYAKDALSVDRREKERGKNKK